MEKATHGEFLQFTYTVSVAGIALYISEELHVVFVMSLGKLSCKGIKVGSKSVFLFR